MNHRRSLCRTPAVAAVVASFASIASADVIHTGAITTPTTWLASDNDHIVVGTVSISQNVTLTIEEGCVVRFDDDARLEVSGTLNAAGGSNGVLFTRRDPDDEWRGVLFHHTASGSLSDCTIEYASSGSSAAGVDVTNGATVSILDCTIRNGSRGIRVNGGSGPVLSGCTIEGNAVGIRYEGATPSLDTANTFLSNLTGVYCLQSANVFIDNQTIVGSSGPEGAIYVAQCGEFTIGPGNVVPGNSWGLTVDVGSGPSVASTGNLPIAGNTNDDGIQVLGGTANVPSTWRNLGADYIFTAPGTIGVAGSLTIDQGVTVRFEPGQYLHVRGSLQAIGGVAGILFTSRLAGQTWNGIRFFDGDGVLEDCTVENVIDNVTGTIQDGVRIQQSTVSLQDCVFRDCYNGVFVTQGPSPSISGCTFEGNVVGLDANQLVAPSLTNANVFTNNQHGVEFSACSDVTIDNQSITGSSGTHGAISMQACGDFTVGPGNTLTGNTWALTIDAGSGPSAASTGNIPLGLNQNDGIQVRTGQSAGNVIWRDMGMPYVVTSSPTIGNPARLTIEDGVTLQFGFNTGMSIAGELLALGAAEGISFLPLTPTLGWGGLSFAAGYGRFDACTISGATSTFSPAALTVSSGSEVELDGCTITGNFRGLRVSSSSISSKRSAIVGNDDSGIFMSGSCSATFGDNLAEWNDIYANGDGSPGHDFINGSLDVTARYVYWGTTDPDVIESHIEHEVDTPQRGLVTFAPWTNADHSIAFGAAMTDVTPPAIALLTGSTTAAWGDYDRDGDDDLFVGAAGPNALFRNDAGALVDVTPPEMIDALTTEDSAWADIDDDGDLDLVAANSDGSTMIYLGQSTGVWLPFELAPSFRSVDLADAEGDGDVDLIAVRTTNDVEVWRFDGGSLFPEVVPGPDAPLTARWGDYDDDGLPDAAIAGADQGAPEVTFLTNVSGTLTPLISYTNVTSNSYQSVSFADSDGDGLANAHVAGYDFEDIVVCSDGQTPTPCTPAALADPAVTLSSSWADYDNDGRLDLFTARLGHDRLYQGIGGHDFVDQATASIAGNLLDDDRGGAWADYDGDGDLDLFIVTSNAGCRLLRNEDGSGNHWFHVDLRGAATNRFGLGAKISVHAGGEERVQEVGTGSGANVQSSTTAEFGLGAAMVIDSVVVRWTTGAAESYGPFAADQKVTLVEHVHLVGGGLQLAIDDVEAVAWGDFDGDGDEDLFTSDNQVGENYLFENVGGSLVDVTPPEFGFPPNASGAAWGDYDNDGTLDLVVASATGQHRLFRNDGGGAFSIVPAGLAMSVTGHNVHWLDYDLDGDLDPYFVTSDSPERLFRNDGGGVFTNATTDGLFGFFHEIHAAFGDFDDDGDLDLHSSRLGERVLLRNDEGTFIDVSAVLPPDDRNGGASWVDYDNDDDLDLFRYGTFQPQQLLRNDDGSFVDVTAATMSRSMSEAAWLDYDNDGDLDLYSSAFNLPLSLIRNDDGVFVDASTEIWPNPRNFISAGVAVADVNGDGGLDVLAASSFDRPEIYRNARLHQHHWLGVRLQGTASNRSGIGARVRVDTGPRRQTREVSVNGTDFTQHSLVQHYGLGESETVDRVVVYWPSGLTQVVQSPPVDTVLTIVEEETVSVPAPTLPARYSLGAAAPNPFRSSTIIDFGLPRASDVTLRIFDISGRLVRVLRDDTMAPGRHGVRWDGRGRNGLLVSPGVYFYRLEAERFQAQRRIVRME